MKTSRIDIVDSLRGFALAGVFLMHMGDMFYVGLPTEEMRANVADGLLDKVVLGLRLTFVMDKFILLFSLLFGVSFYLQFSRAKVHNAVFYARYTWRLLLLFLFGLFLHLFYAFEILMIYAVLGLFLIPLNQLSNRWLIPIAMVFLLGGGTFSVFALWGSAPLFGSPNLLGPEHNAAMATLAQGDSLLDVMAYNATTGMQLKLNGFFGLAGRGYMVFGVFLIGLWIGRSGFFSELMETRAKLKTFSKYAVLHTLVAIALLVPLGIGVSIPLTFTSWREVFIYPVTWYLFSYGLAILYACGFLAMGYHARTQRFVGAFRAYGRMALTNYIAQGVLGSFIFFGWGLEKVTDWRAATCVMMGLLLIALQMLLSHLWMKYFNYGPVEWLWRILTHLRWYPILKPAAPVTATS